MSLRGKVVNSETTIEVRISGSSSSAGSDLEVRHTSAPNHDEVSESEPLLGSSNRHLLNKYVDDETAGVILNLFALFVAESSRGMVIPTMTPYIFYMGGTLSDVGIAVSLFSVGKLISANPLAYLTEYTGSTRLGLILSALLSAFANIFYGTAYLSNSVWIVIASRFVLGMSTSIMGVGRAYMAAAAASKSVGGESPLAQYIAWAGVVQYVGFSLTPIFSAVVGGIGGNSDNPNFLSNLFDPKPSPNINVIDFVLPAYFLAFLNFLLVILLLLFMLPTDPLPPPSSSHRKSAHNSVEDLNYAEISNSETINFEKQSASTSHSITPKFDDSDSDSSDSSDSISETVSSIDVSSNVSEVDPKIMSVAFIVFFYMNFVIRGIIGVVETLAPDQHQYILGPDHENLASTSAIYFTILGLFGLVTFLSLDWVTKKLGMNNNHMLAVGIACIGLGSILTIPQVHERRLWVFTVGMFFVWSIGSPICQTLTILCLSELMGNAPQAVVMSNLTNVGTVGRILFPALASVLLTMVSILARKRIKTSKITMDFHTKFAPFVMDCGDYKRKFPGPKEVQPLLGKPTINILLSRFPFPQEILIQIFNHIFHAHIATTKITAKWEAQVQSDNWYQRLTYSFSENESTMVHINPNGFAFSTSHCDYCAKFNGSGGEKSVPFRLSQQCKRTFVGMSAADALYSCRSLFPLVHVNSWNLGIFGVILRHKMTGYGLEISEEMGCLDLQFGFGADPINAAENEFAVFISDVLELFNCFVPVDKSMFYHPAACAVMDRRLSMKNYYRCDPGLVAERSGSTFKAKFFLGRWRPIFVENVVMKSGALFEDSYFSDDSAVPERMKMGLWTLSQFSTLISSSLLFYRMLCMWEISYRNMPVVQNSAGKIVGVWSVCLQNQQRNDFKVMFFDYRGLAKIRLPNEIWREPELMQDLLDFVDFMVSNECPHPFDIRGLVAGSSG
ncbi:hypothetical protein HK098_007033 [Nowakowskiella sp. JEL0407]|nr:hypothetical protein HK098_007033 [Nowakowskiella sp. JEL0407]